MNPEKTGIIYLMKSVINGVYKIGISRLDQFESRMYNLEKNGYDNIVGLKRVIAIKTENYEAKEKMLHDIFSKSRIANTEFFAVDRNLVEQLFYSLKGEVIFPKKVDVEEKIEEIVERKEIEVSRSVFVEMVNDLHKENPQVLRDILGDREEYKERGSRIKLYKNAYVSDSGNYLTRELENGLHFYVTFSRKRMSQAMDDYHKLFERNRK